MAQQMRTINSAVNARKDWRYVFLSHLFLTRLVQYMGSIPHLVQALGECVVANVRKLVVKLRAGHGKHDVQGTHMIEDMAELTKRAPNLKQLKYWVIVRAASGIQCRKHQLQFMQRYEHDFDLVHGDCAAKTRDALTNTRPSRAALNNLIGGDCEGRRKYSSPRLHLLSSSAIDLFFGYIRTLMYILDGVEFRPYSQQPYLERVLHLKCGSPNGPSSKTWSSRPSTTECPDLLCVAWYELKVLSRVHKFI